MKEKMPKKQRAALILALKPKDEMDSEDAAEGDEGVAPEAKKAAARSVMEALDAHDESAFASALEDFVASCD